MLTVHFNGEIVRHPDTKLIQDRIKERNDRENRCKYGVQFLNCQVWVKHCNDSKDIKQISKFGRCHLSGGEKCPQYKKRVDAGNTDKTFKIDSGVYRKLASTAHYIIKESKTKTLFLTLTLPPFKRKHKLTKSFIYESTYYETRINEAFSRFIENCRRTYKASDYIAVRERGEKDNRLHIHLVISMPFVRFDILNNAWCHAIQGFCEYSRNALQTRADNRVIKNPVRAIKYVCKYISKAINKVSFTRVYFISNNTLSSWLVNPDTGELTKHSNIKRSIDNRYLHIQELLKDYKGIYIQTFEYTTTFRVTNPADFNKFCLLILYPLFNSSEKYSHFLHNW